jgi:hypothetical protein
VNFTVHVSGENFNFIDICEPRVAKGRHNESKCVNVTACKAR